MTTMLLLWLFLTALLFIFSSAAIEGDADIASNANLLSEVFPHYNFVCHPLTFAYESTFTFLDGFGYGYVYAEHSRVYFEYYFPAKHWVGFAAADQSIEGVADHCTECYFAQSSSSPLLGNCTEECLDDAIYIATVNSDELNLNDWSIIEFQISAQHSKKLNKKMYRIPQESEILELWGDQAYPYRQQAHFKSELVTGTDGTELVHAKFWRQYDFAPDEEIDEYDESNEWKPFTQSPQAKQAGLAYADMFCFISVASYVGGEYPYDVDALNDYIPGFYIDTDALAQMHCFRLDEIKKDCGQDWSFLTANSTNGQIDFDSDTYGFDSDIDIDTYTDTDSDTDAGSYDTDDATVAVQPDTTGVASASSTAVSATTTTATSTTKAKAATTTTSSTTTTTTTSSTTKLATSSVTTATTSSTPSSTESQVAADNNIVEDDCCSAVSGISYHGIDCADLDSNSEQLQQLESKWKTEQCGRMEKLPTDLTEAVSADVDDDNMNCYRLWAQFNQIHEYCHSFKALITSMGVYNHFITRGGFECFQQHSEQCSPRNAENSRNADAAAVADLDSDTFSDDDDMFSDDDVDDVDVDVYDDDGSSLLAAAVMKPDAADTKESEFAEMEEDGGLTMTSLGVLGIVLTALATYVLYWFCCSNSSKGYQQHMMRGNGYFDDDIDTEEYLTKNDARQQYMERINGGYREYRDREQQKRGSVEEEEDEENNDSDWSVDEQLGAVVSVNDDDDDVGQEKATKKKSKKKKKKKKKSKAKNVEYDIAVNDINSMPLQSDNATDENGVNANMSVGMNDAIEVSVVVANNDQDEDVLESDLNETMAAQQECQQNGQ